MVEFTGERVIPGQVNDDLWSEHVARYAFARRYAGGKRVLDAGCGTGYGSAELAQSAAAVTGVDISAEAIEYASASYPIPGLQFLEASCMAAPLPDHSFDVVVAFEVIEHLADYRAFLDECARIVTPEGLLVISSPNKRYYAETRAATGPNPFHEHEFEAQEFVHELQRVFANVRLLLQNRVESFAFHPAVSFWPAEARIDGGGGSAEDAHFFIGMCSGGPLPDPKSFVYVPKAANVLRERELHVEALQQQLAQIKADREALLEFHRQQTQELEERNRWAQSLDATLEVAAERIIALENEAAELAELITAYQAQVAQMEQEDRVKTEWARKVSAELEAKCQELADCVRLLDTAEATVRERTVWAQTAEAQRAELAAKLEMVRASRWLRMGRTVGLGPEV
ncbi:MAG TPA: methyltransferase domain-containing protein [Bryobacteraceae bacterium]|nr:methyltransferase domain-containing protein [Bryobacteraceae bacterium]